MLHNRRASLIFFAFVAGCVPNCAAREPSTGGVGTQVESAAAPPDAPASPHAPPVASRPTAPTGLEGRWSTQDVVPPHPAHPPEETLSLARAAWGIEAPNLLKSLAVAWDASAGRLYAASIATDRLGVIDPAVGRPTGTLDLELPCHHAAMLQIDEKRRTLWRVDKGDGSLRVVDLASGALVARTEAPRGGRSPEGRDYPFRDAALDPATGWMWVVDLNQNTLTGYSPDLKQTKVATGITVPGSIDARADELLIVDAPSPREGRLLRYRPSTGEVLSTMELPPHAGPVSATFAPDGSVMLGGGRLALLGADGAPRWTQSLPGTTEEILFVGDTVVVLLGDAQRGAARGRGRAGEGPRGERPPGEGSRRGGAAGAGGGPRGERPPGAGDGQQGDRPAAAGGAAEPAAPAEGRVLLFDFATGAPRGEVQVRYEARSATADLATGRVYVANGGDASVSVIDVATARVTHTYNVGAAAEHVLVDPKTGDRYVVDRLGGSEVHRWRFADGGVDALPAGKWPADAVLDADRRRLWLLGHYTSTLDGLALDSGAPLPSIDLGLPESRSDTLGDLDHDPAVGIAAVALPESGGLAVVDLVAGKVLWSRVDAGLAAGVKAGPGSGLVAVDGKRDRLYVVAERGARVLAYRLRSGEQVGELTLATPPSRGEMYNVNGAFLDRAAGRLYVGAYIVDVPALTEAGRLDGVGKVFWSDPSTLLALGMGKRPRDPEQLLELDAKSGAVRSTHPLVPGGMMRLNAAYDPLRRVVYVADMAEARVLAYRWPAR